MPSGETADIPARWAHHKCIHMEDGSILLFANDLEALDIASDRDKEGETEMEEPEWSSNIDASKGIGYPARETGRYGSYPSHDGFDDESEP